MKISEQYEIRIPRVGVFHARSLASATRRAHRERKAIERQISGPAPHAAIFLHGARVAYIA